MKFNFFSSTQPQTGSSVASTGSAAEDALWQAERTALNVALYALLEGLPHSIKGKDHLKRLCDTILDATPHLRLVWIGFCDGSEDMIMPHAAIGEAVQEACDWRLPQACFDFANPYSQAALESVGELNDLNSLFLPWHGNMDACTVSSALAIPLRSSQENLRGLIVFYADDINYFAYLSSAPFQAFCHVAEVIWQQSSLLHLLTQKAQLDALTGLMNRRAMSGLLQKMIDRTHSENELLSIMLLRLGHYGEINESYGWATADALLAQFAKEVALQTRAQDRLARWTGVEFLVLLPRTELRHAQFLAQGLQAYFASRPLSIQGQAIYITLQIGVATYAQSDHGVDDLLLAAKRNMVATITST